MIGQSLKENNKGDKDQERKNERKKDRKMQCCLRIISWYYRKSSKYIYEKKCLTNIRVEDADSFPYVKYTEENIN